MSIDDYAGGAGRGAASLLYRNRDDDFPDWAGRVTAIGEAVLLRLGDLCGDTARIVVTTVYDPSDGPGQVATSGLAPWPDGPVLVEELNAALIDLAERHGA